MERIASFCVDHTRLERGMYLSRQDGDVLTWDIRMKKPNQGDYLTTAAAHTLEHLFATYARNSAVKDGVIYVGPMGCRTGFYLLTRGLTPAQALQLTVDAYRFMAGFEGAVPGASEVECGNYRDMDLPAAKAEAAAMLPVLEALTAEDLHYGCMNQKGHRTVLCAVLLLLQNNAGELFIILGQGNICGRSPALFLQRYVKSVPRLQTPWRCRPRTLRGQCGRSAASGLQSRWPYRR